MSKSHNFVLKKNLNKYKSIFSYPWAQNCPEKFSFGIKGKCDFQ